MGDRAKEICDFLASDNDSGILDLTEEKKESVWHKLPLGTGKEISIREVAEKIMEEIGFKGELRWDSSKPDGTLRKLTDVTKLHGLGWHHQVEIDEGIHRLYEWYLQGICINHQTV